MRWIDRRRRHCPVLVDEVVAGVRIALSQAEVSACESFDEDQDGRVTVTELVRGVGSLLGSCS